VKFTNPNPDAVFVITADAEWPSILFQTDGSGAHVWNWDVVWGTFKQSGAVNTSSNQWDARSVVANSGGTLTVRANANNQVAITVVRIKGTNPTAGQVTQFLAAQPGSAGFDKIISHESQFRHFTLSGEPIKSFDNGYGMCQLTNPTPTFDKVWNWKLNVQGGLSLFAGKRAQAISYLSQNGRGYTDEQLKYEAVCRWNGGYYHDWDEASKKWVRRTDVLCDSTTGNIGWDMSDSTNQGKTEATLHKRDSSGYGKGKPGPADHWGYFGACYADKVLA